MLLTLDVQRDDSQTAKSETGAEDVYKGLFDKYAHESNKSPRHHVTRVQRFNWLIHISSHDLKDLSGSNITVLVQTMDVTMLYGFYGFYDFLT